MLNCLTNTDCGAQHLGNIIHLLVIPLYQKNTCCDNYKKLDQDLLIINNISKKRNRYQYYVAYKTPALQYNRNYISDQARLSPVVTLLKRHSHHLCSECYCPHQGSSLTDKFSNFHTALYWHNVSSTVYVN